VTTAQEQIPERHRVLIRTWNILVLLRERPRTLTELAKEFGVNERTIRRDLNALCEVGFPVITSRDDLDWPQGNVCWSLAPIPNWPRRESTPTGKYGRSPGSKMAIATRAQ
jgi:hypothetical protein